MKEKEIGRYCEGICSNYLKKKGYNILEKNYHSRYGEIDIIAQDDKYLVFVEVKSRKEDTIVKGLEAVNNNKMIKIIKTAYQYLSQKDLNLQPRFDVCEIYFIKNKINNEEMKIKIKKINYIKNAFDLSFVNLDIKL